VHLGVWRNGFVVLERDSKVKVNYGDFILGFLSKGGWKIR
jgi:hypothetical protein